MNRSRPTSVTAFLLLTLLALPAVADLATFDDFDEGYYTTQLTDDGITFYELDQRVPSPPPPHPFVIEWAEAELNAFPDSFSPPNACGFGGYGPGPGVVYTRCGEFKFRVPYVANVASAEFFYLTGDAGNTVAMEAVLDGEVVARDVFVFTGGWALRHFTLQVAGVDFDHIRITGEGSDEGVFFAVMDNVYVDQVVATQTTSWSDVKTLFR